MKKYNLSLFLIVLFFNTVVSAYSLQYHPFLLQTKDSKGITLAKTLDGIYGEKITVKNGRCYFIEQQGQKDVEYEIDRCKVEYLQKKVYSQADRLNGIEVKGQIWVEGNSYRTRTNGQNWTEWKSSEFMSGTKWYSRTGTVFMKKNGEFVFEPTKGLKSIRGDYKYMSKHRTEAIENGDASGIVIKESGSGDVVIQESR